MTHPRRLTVAAVTALLGSVGCGPGALDPSATGGELLPGAEDIDYFGGRPFSLSPDGRWLIFARSVSADRLEEGGEELDFQLARLAAYELYDLGAARARSVTVDPEVAGLIDREGAVLLDGGCWIETPGGLRVLLRNAFRSYIGVDPDRPDPTWEVVEPDDGAGYREACPERPRHEVPPNPVGPFVIEGDGTRRITISDRPDADRILATHSAPLLSTGIQIGDVRISRDGSRLAYSITPVFGSFVSGTRGFFVDRLDPAQSRYELASPVRGLRWAPDATALYAAVDHERALKIFRWGTPRPTRSELAEGTPLDAVVVDNVTACVVDAVCYLTLQLGDTTVQAVYGTGERPAPACSVPAAVSDAAFGATRGEEVTVVLSRCDGIGWVIDALER